MQAALDGRDWELTARTSGEVVDRVPARRILREIAEASWECADPGVQFDTTINRWNTTPNAGRIEASNPCSEHLRLANSACNLASLNLLSFLDEDGHFDADGFEHAVRVVVTAQDILVGASDYPTDKIAEQAHAARDIGIGYTNLGAALMALGLPYDSEDGRAWAATVTGILTGTAAVRSTELAAPARPGAAVPPGRRPPGPTSTACTWTRPAPWTRWRPSPTSTSTWCSSGPPRWTPWAGSGPATRS